MSGRLASGSRRFGAGPSAAAASLIALLAIAGPWAAGPVAAVSPVTGINVTLPTGHTISGRVTGPGGTPVAGADAVAVGSFGSADAGTAADGSYTIQGLPDGTYQVQLYPPPGSPLLVHWYGAPTSSQDPTGAADVVVSGANVVGIDQELEAGTSISGTVTGVSGDPVSGIEVDASGQVGAGSATVAADGTYALTGLFPGSYTLSIRAPNSPYLSGGIAAGAVIDSPFGVTAYDTSGGPLSGVDIQLATGVSISGHVTGGDGPVEVDAEDVGGGENFASAVASSSGDYTITGLWPSSYDIQFVPPTNPNQLIDVFPYGAYADGALVDQYSAVPVDATGGDITLSPITIPAGAALSGKITSGGAAVAGAYLYICDPNLGCVSTITLADGTYRIGHMETGDFIIAVSSAHHPGGYYSSSGLVADQASATPVHVDSTGPDVGGINLALPTGGTISGRITVAGGVPVSGARIFALDSSGQIAPVNPGMCTTGPDGRYTCDGLATGPYRLQVNPPVGSNDFFGYYDASAAGHYTSDFNQASQIRVVDPSDHTPPTVRSMSPVAGSTGVARNPAVTAIFSEGVLNVTGKSFTLTNTKTGQAVAATVILDDTTKTATLQPKALLAGHMKYRAALSNAITDWNGNKLASVSWTFTTSADITPPTVVLKNPPAKSTGVPSDSSIYAVFSEAMESVSGATFKVVEKQTGLVLAGTVSYDPGSFAATFADFGLNSNTAYTVTLTSGITDLAGNPLARTSWTFTTGQ